MFCLNSSEANASQKENSALDKIISENARKLEVLNCLQTTFSQGKISRSNKKKQLYLMSKCMLIKTKVKCGEGRIGHWEKV